jgi:hypothetical protein
MYEQTNVRQVVGWTLFFIITGLGMMWFGIPVVKICGAAMLLAGAWLGYAFVENRPGENE